MDGEKGTGIETGSESAEISGASNGGLVGVQQNSNAVLGKVQTTTLETETDLATAVEEAINEGEKSLELNDDTQYTFTRDVNIDEDFVLDMGGASLQGTGWFVVNDVDFTLKNGTYEYTGSKTAVVINSGADVTLEDVEITTESGNPVALFGKNPKLTVSGSDTLLRSDKWYVIGTNGSSTHGAEIVINDGVIEAGNEGAIYLPGEGGNITINGGQISGYQGGVQLCSGSLEMNGGLIEVSWDGEPIKVDGIAADGNVYDGAAISFFSREGYYGQTETDNSIVIHGGELISSSNSPLFIYGGKKSISGWTISSEIQFLENLTIDGGIFTVLEGDEPAVKILNDDMPKVLAITGGTYSSDISKYLPNGYQLVPGTDGNYDVMSGEEYIETDLAAAVNKAIEEGKTSLKLNDTLYTFRSDVNIESDFVLDMGEASVQGTGRFVVSGADFTLKNGIYDYTDNNTAVVINSGADVTLEDVKITTHESGNPVMLYGQNPKLTVSGSDTLLSSDQWYVIGTNGSSTHGAEIVINDGVIEAGNEGAIYLPGEGGNITINGGQISGYQGGVQLCSGSLEMNGGLIEVSWDGEPIQVDGIAADGNVYDGAAISFFSREGYYGETETDNSIVIHGGELISRANSPLFIYGGKKSTNGCAISSEIQFLENLTIDGGIFTVSEGDEPAVRILNDDMPEVLAITGGTYSSDINEYVADGFKCVANGSNYIVVDDSLKEDQPTEIAERVTVSIDTNSAVNDAVSGLTAEQAEAARTEAESTVSTFISEVSGNAAVNEFAGTGLAAAIDTANIPSSKVSNPNLAEVFVKTELNDVELETNVNSDGTVSVNISKLVFDITPFIKEPGKDAVEIENEWLNGRGITVRLPIPASRASERSYVTVKHIADDGSDRTYYPSVREENGNYYCELTVMHFSTFEMTFNARPALSDSSGSRNESNRNSVSKGTIYADGTTSGIMNHSTGTWKQNETGWWFERTDGSYPANTWEKLSWNGRENWYHFNAAGYLDAGWFTDTDGSTYYLHNTHDNNFGYMYTGWNMINGNYYYFFNETDGGHKEGSMARGMVTPDGYTVNEDGIWTE